MVQPPSSGFILVGIAPTLRMPLQKLLVAYDGTEQAMRALEFAINLLQDNLRQGTEIHLVYVAEKLHGVVDPIPDEVMTSVEKVGAEILSNGARIVKKRLENPVVHLEIGSPPQKILELADKLKPDLVVVGIANHPAVERILGTVSSRLFKSRRHAVLGVP